MVFKNLKIMLVMSVLLLISGCTSTGLDPNALISANSQVKSFLDEYPNADLNLLYYSQNDSISVSEEYKELCERDFSPKNLYKFYVRDTTSGLNIVGFLDVNNQVVDCVVKKGIPQEEVSELKEENSSRIDELEEEVQRLEEELLEKELDKEIQRLKEELEEDLDKLEEDLKEKLPEVYIDEEFDWDETYESEDFGLKIQVVGNKAEIEWDKYEGDDFQYYKLLHSTSNKYVTYPEKYANYVGMKSTDTDFTHYDIEEGVNYYRLGIVLKGDEVIHSEPLTIYFGKDEIEEISIKVLIFDDFSEIEIELDEKEYELTLDETDVHELKEIISEKYDLDMNLIISNIEIDYKESEIDKEEFEELKGELLNEISELEESSLKLLNLEISIVNDSELEEDLEDLRKSIDELILDLENLESYINSIELASDLDDLSNKLEYYESELDDFENSLEELEETVKDKIEEGASEEDSDDSEETSENQTSIE